MTAAPGTSTFGPPAGDHSFAHLPTAFVCEGCGYRSPAAARVPMRCPAALPGDDIDHVLGRTLDPDRLDFPTGTEANPFVRYRSLFHAAHVASALGWTDREYVALVARLDRAVRRVDGHGFSATPLLGSERLGRRLGMRRPVLVKDETHGVSGSHKARHLMGTALELEVAEALERADPVLGGSVRPARLAIASCGNAALAAAVVARAWQRELLVFVPPEADPAILDRLRHLEAVVTIVDRIPGVPGDPTVHRLRAAVEDGAVPFTCQGGDNGLALEGGETLGYELVTDLLATGRRLDRLVVQVGGGALASSCARAFDDARRLGALDAPPRLHAVQSDSTRPLVRAYDLVADRLAGLLGLGPIDGLPGVRDPMVRAGAAERLQEALLDPKARDVLVHVAHHRAAFMWPWESVPRSVAGGILDDETYDWLAVVRAMLQTGGYPIVASEDRLREANRVGRTSTGIDVDHTGSAGLAGLIELRLAGLVDPDETVAVLFTGIRRTPGPRPVAAPHAHRGATP